MKTHWRFTLLEVVIALAILPVSLPGLLQVLISSQERLAKSIDQWRQMHMLMQAAEYYLLQSEDPDDISTDFFPYKDYKINCYYEEAENLPEDYDNQLGQLPLRSCIIELVRRKDGALIDKLIIDRISYESATATTQ